MVLFTPVARFAIGPRSHCAIRPPLSAIGRGPRARRVRARRLESSLVPHDAEVRSSNRPLAARVDEAPAPLDSRSILSGQARRCSSASTRAHVQPDGSRSSRPPSCRCAVLPKSRASACERPCDRFHRLGTLSSWRRHLPRARRPRHDGRGEHAQRGLGWPPPGAQAAASGDEPAIWAMPICYPRCGKLRATTCAVRLGQASTRMARVAKAEGG